MIFSSYQDFSAARHEFSMFRRKVMLSQGADEKQIADVDDLKKVTYVCMFMCGM